MRKVLGMNTKHSKNLQTQISDYLQELATQHDPLSSPTISHHRLFAT